MTRIHITFPFLVGNVVSVKSSASSSLKDSSLFPSIFHHIPSLGISLASRSQFFTGWDFTKWISQSQDGL